MRTPVLVLAAVLAALAIGGCGSSTSDVVAARTAAKTVNGLCPVREEPVVPYNFTEYQGQRIGFCCPPCKKDFEAEPERYLKKMRDHREKFGYVGN